MNSPAVRTFTKFERGGAPNPLRLDPQKSLQRLNWVGIFGSKGPVHIEIGIGKGRFLLAAAAARPHWNFLGVEWANKYLRVAEERAMKKGLKNVRFMRVDAQELLQNAIPSASVSAYYVFYPDPWPKRRHLKRRFFQPLILDQMARTLKPGGELHVATDHEEYWDQIERALESNMEFRWLPKFGGKDFPLSADLPLTNYEAKYRVQGRSRYRASWRLFPL